MRTSIFLKHFRLKIVQVSNGKKEENLAIEVGVCVARYANNANSLLHLLTLQIFLLLAK